MISCLDLRFVKTGEFPFDVTPTRGSEGAAGWDVRAALHEPLHIFTHQTVKVPTGIAVELPEGYYFQVWARSGLASKKGLGVLAGIIDWDYRGEINVILQNNDVDLHRIEPGERVGQLVLCRYIPAAFTLAESISATARGSEGFGSTGTH